MSPDQQGPALLGRRQLVAPVYVPLVLVIVGEGMLVPTLPLWLADAGAGYLGVTAVVTGAGIGNMVANLPAGAWLERFGPRRVALAGLALISLSTPLLGVLGPSATAGLVVLRVAAGAGAVMWLLSRQTLVRHRSDPAVRGRALSLVGGTQRLGLLIGPAAGGYLAETVSYRASFAAAGAISALALAVVSRDQTDHRPPPTAGDEAPSGVLAEHRRALLLVGSAQLGAMAIRFGRQLIVPLIGAEQGLDAGRVGLVVSCSALVDLAVFWVSGPLMDRRGRLWAIVPAFAIMALGMASLALVSDFVTLLAAGALIGLGNGIGSGTMLTVGLDLAPDRGTASFLAGLGLIRDGGRVAGPAAVGAVAAGVGLEAAAVTLAAVGVATVAVFVIGVGETAPPSS